MRISMPSVANVWHASLSNGEKPLAIACSCSSSFLRLVGILTFFIITKHVVQLPIPPQEWDKGTSFSVATSRIVGWPENSHSELVLRNLIFIVDSVSKISVNQKLKNRAILSIS